ncbi:MAG: polysaccharide deacetylase family protein [Deltaproteobacteria bacterium]|nr:polysaccharide deacetylase family protein [Deltaproteobacteria bacterium]
MTSPQRTLCVNIDLDDLRYYRAIHGLPEGPDTPLIFEKAVPRFLDFCEISGVRSTLFVIGRDMQWSSARDGLSRAVAQGHEVASHSLSHFYDLSRRPRSEMNEEVHKAREVIGEALGLEVAGFRAPGYNLTPALLEVVAGAGHTYDSSVLPSPAYYLARAAVIGKMALKGRTSASIRGRAGDFFRTPVPFSWGEPSAGLKEFPITACGFGRLPLIGTTLARGGLQGTLPLRGAGRLPFVNLEFHALDFLDREKDGIEADLAVEPALTIPLERRLERFENAVRRLSKGRTVRTLDHL